MSVAQRSRVDLSHSIVPEAVVNWIAPAVIRVEAPWLSVDVALAGEGASHEGQLSEVARSAIACHLVHLPLVLVSSNPREDGWLARVVADYANGKVGASEHDNEGMPDRLHPLCAYSRLRHYIFASLAAAAPRDVGPPSLTLLIHCLQQAWYVTSQSVAALSAGLSGGYPPSFERLLWEYVEEERGHHKFIENSLHFLGTAPDPCAVSAGTQEAMLLLSHAAATNGLTLACCITYFEMGGWLESDPMANALRQQGHGAAARQIEAHFRINKDRDHALFPLRLVDALDSVSQRDVHQACQTTRAVAVALQSALREGFQ